MRGSRTGARNDYQSLHSALQDLVQRSVIDTRLLEWADNLRLLGNVGAHATAQPVTEQDAYHSLDLIEALLDYVYVFTAKFDQFKVRRSAAGQPPFR